MTLTEQPGTLSKQPSRDRKVPRGAQQPTGLVPSRLTAQPQESGRTARECLCPLKIRSGGRFNCFYFLVFNLSPRNMSSPYFIPGIFGMK